MSRTLRQVATTTLLGTATLLSACAKKDAATTDSTSATTTTASTATTVTPAPAADSAKAAPTDPAHFTDANILAKLMAADSGEVAIGTTAQSMATSKGVKEYAALLVSDHGKGLKEVTALAQKLSITPQAPAGDTTSQAVSHEQSRLQGIAKGTAFDTAFVNHEVEDHQQDIKDAEAMSGAAQNAEVKALVQKVLPELKKHLDKAQKLASSTK